MTFRRSDVSVSQKETAVPMLLQEHQTSFSTGNGVVGSPSSKAPFVASESTIGMAETSSLSSASAREMKQFTFLPNDYSPKKKSSNNTDTVWDKENIGPNAGDGRQLSPCSKLAQRWTQTKERRRVARKDNVGSHNVISPVTEVLSPKLVPEEKNDVETRGTLGSDMFIPTLSRHRNGAVNTSFVPTESEVSPRPFDSLGKKVVTPETCPISEESFLQDYWGE